MANMTKEKKMPKGKVTRGGKKPEAAGCLIIPKKPFEPDLPPSPHCVG